LTDTLKLQVGIFRQDKIYLSVLPIFVGLGFVQQVGLLGVKIY